MTTTLPVWIDDPINAAILAVSEDRLSGFQHDPFGQVAERAGVPVETVLERIVAMLDSGTIIVPPPVCICGNSGCAKPSAKAPAHKVCKPLVMNPPAPRGVIRG